eukprot:TRINITY_DN14773_c0_g1_i2.p3 TRINITY_DN14773_c0_g1~~TRINITY_DN14773_c0_g1_i2.p3  ORF type:complete len:105 (-),score=15.64 TRINITY_DN14773_c0_g1_i2:1505-1819(-)
MHCGELLRIVIVTRPSPNMMRSSTPSSEIIGRILVMQGRIGPSLGQQQLKQLFLSHTTKQLPLTGELVANLDTSTPLEENSLPTEDMASRDGSKWRKYGRKQLR